MRLIEDTKLDYRIWEDIDELTLSILEKAYRHCCYGHDEPDVMEISPDMFENLRDGLFKNHPEFGMYQKFHNARITFVDISNKIIKFVRLQEPLKDREKYKLNCIIVLN